MDTRRPPICKHCQYEQSFCPALTSENVLGKEGEDITVWYTDEWTCENCEVWHPREMFIENRRTDEMIRRLRKYSPDLYDWIVLFLVVTCKLTLVPLIFWFFSPKSPRVERDCLFHYVFLWSPVLMNDGKVYFWGWMKRRNRGSGSSLETFECWWEYDDGTWRTDWRRVPKVVGRNDEEYHYDVEQEQQPENARPL